MPVCYGDNVETVIVFRSADSTAEMDARDIADMLTAAGIGAILSDDSARGVPEGAWEVQVPASDSAKADRLIATHPIASGDKSHALDMVTVFHSAGASTEFEAMTVKGLLEASGIPVITVADARYPNLPEEVRVPRDQVTEARRLIANALTAGPAAAEEAEAETEPGAPSHGGN